MHSDQTEICSIHGAEMDGEKCPDCEAELIRYYDKEIEEFKDEEADALKEWQKPWPNYGF